MNDFAYKAYDTKGQIREGQIPAENEQAALQAVRTLGLMPIEIKQGGQNNFLKQLIPRFENSNQLSNANRERYLSSLSTMLDSGFLLPDCHRFLANDTTDKTLAAFSKSILEKLQSGMTLSSSLRNSNTGFDMAQIAAITAGEKSGNLFQPLRHVADVMKTNNANREKLVSAMIYPAILVLTSFASIAVVATVLVPNLMPIFEGRESEMPAGMRFLVFLRSFLSDNLAVLSLVLFCLVLLLRQLVKTPFFRALWQRVLRKITFIRKLEAARISSSLSLMLRGGTTLLDAVKLCASNAGNAQSGRELALAVDMISEGRPFREAIQKIAVFGPMDIQMLSVAENANRLETVLDHVAATNNSEAMRQLERFIGLLTPIMTLLMGVLIGGLIYSVMRSILGINQLVQ
jgi:general secretion pathway protein F